MTLIDEYRRAVYFPTQEERRRRLEPLPTPTNYLNEIQTSTSISRRIHGTRNPLMKRTGSHIRLETLKLSNETKPKSPNRKPKPSKSTSASPSVSNQVDDRPLSVSTSSTPIITLENLNTGGHVSKTPSELPSQFLDTPHINISKWTTIVSDRTLLRLMQQNKRIQTLKHNQTMSRLTSATISIGSEQLLTKSLYMNGATGITDHGLVPLAQTVPTLEVLEMSDANKITDEGLRALALHCTQLVRLNIARCIHIRGAGLGAIAEHCHRLVHLDIAECPQFEEWVLIRCFFAFPLLEFVNLSKCYQVTDTLLKTLANQCPKLRNVLLSECDMVTDVGMVQLAQRCRALEKIVLYRMRNNDRITDTTCAALGEHCSLLRDVNLSGCTFITDVGIQWLAKGSPRLQVLDISNMFHVTDAALRALSMHCCELKSLRLVNVKNISDVGLRLLSMGCCQLQVLHLNNLYLVSDGSNRDFGLEGLQAIAKGCSELKELNLTGCFQLVERALVAVGTSCPTLERVNLKACPKITLLAVNTLLHGCPMLVSLNLTGVVLCTNAMLAAIGVYGVALKELWIAQCEKVSDQGLCHLATRIDQLELLDVSECPLITDVGINALLDGMQDPHLSHLYLSGCSLITQDVIARLAFVCPFLLTLCVQGCRITARVLQSLSSSWPLMNLRVPTAAPSVARLHDGLGMFPVPRAKDRRFVEQTCVLWAAAVQIQNAFRARVARREAQIHREFALQNYVVRRLQSQWRGRQARRIALLRKLLVSDKERAVIKIQRKYRETRSSRRAQSQMRAIYRRQVEKYARIVQRRYRAKRAVIQARATVAARRRQRQQEVQAAIVIQKRYRRIAARRRLNIVYLQKIQQEREERDASIRLQALYRGRADRRRAADEKIAKAKLAMQQQESALRIQTQYRRYLGWKEAERRRAYNRFLELCAIKLQTAYRAKRSRQKFDLLRLTLRQAECEHAANLIQRNYRGRKDRLGFQVLHEARRIRSERQRQAAIFLQRFYRRYLLRKGAQGIMDELRQLHRKDYEMEVWAATLMQACWRRLQALRLYTTMQLEQRTRWKQLVDTNNERGRGYGAPFYYNQVNAQVRWRMPREILSLQPQPTCNQCAGGLGTVECARIECATCCEYFCPTCHDVVHGRGKRRAHRTRPLYDYYERRRIYKSEEVIGTEQEEEECFPSLWPSEIDQDRTRGYDFVNMIPKENYENMLMDIQQFIPVSTGRWDIPMPYKQQTVEEAEALAAREAAARKQGLALLFREDDVDENGTSLWYMFYDNARAEYRYYHSISKRVTSNPPLPQQ